MIAKTYFLVKIIHRISTKNLHDKKSLRENFGRISHIPRIAGSSPHKFLPVRPDGGAGNARGRFGQLEQ
jgi:hypothetical protein